MRARVKELESQLGSLQLDSGTASHHPTHDAANIKHEENALPENLDPLGQLGGNRNYYNWAFALREVKAKISSTGKPSAFDLDTIKPNASVLIETWNESTYYCLTSSSLETA
jgi:hypothetical protein